MTASLDHYTGRPITDVKESDEGYDIYLEGGIIIHNTDKRRSMPDLDEVKGMQLSSVLLSENQTRIVFVNQDDDGNLIKSTTIFLTPTQYYIADPRFDTPQYPQESEVDAVLNDRPEEPAERLQEGPEDDDGA